MCCRRSSQAALELYQSGEGMPVQPRCHEAWAIVDEKYISQDILGRKASDVTGFVQQCLSVAFAQKSSVIKLPAWDQVS